MEQLGYGVPLPSVHENLERWQGWGAGKTALVTGANAGLGYFTALALAASGAHVILACRSAARATVAREQIMFRVPSARLSTMELDTANYQSVDQLAAALEMVPLDILIANAGIIHTPSTRQQNHVGDELTMATNFLGHARLVGKLAPMFRSRELRFIGLGSMATRILPSDPDNLALRQGYGAYRAYTQSKAALQAFTLGLDHRLKLLSWPSRSFAVHPGYSISGLTVKVPGVNEPRFAKRYAGQLQGLFAQGKHQGAVPIVEAALNPGMVHTGRGVYLGPALLNKGTTRMVTPATLTRRKKLLDPVWQMFLQANGGRDPFALATPAQNVG